MRGRPKLACVTNVTANTVMRTGYVLFVVQQVGIGILKSKLKQRYAMRCSHT